MEQTGAKAASAARGIVPSLGPGRRRVAGQPGSSTFRVNFASPWSRHPRSHANQDRPRLGSICRMPVRRAGWFPWQAAEAIVPRRVSSRLGHEEVIQSSGGGRRPPDQDISDRLPTVWGDFEHRARYNSRIWWRWTRPRLAARGVDVAARLHFLSEIVWANIASLICLVVFLSAAIVMRRRPEIHKRLMLLASISILPPAMTRIIDWPVWGFGNNALFPLLCCTAMFPVALGLLRLEIKQSRASRNPHGRPSCCRTLCRERFRDAQYGGRTFLRVRPLQPYALKRRLTLAQHVPKRTGCLCLFWFRSRWGRGGHIQFGSVKRAHNGHHRRPSWSLK